MKTSRAHGGGFRKNEEHNQEAGRRDIYYLLISCKENSQVAMVKYFVSGVLCMTKRTFCKGTTKGRTEQVGYRFRIAQRRAIAITFSPMEGIMITRSSCFSPF